MNNQEPIISIILDCPFHGKGLVLTSREGNISIYECQEEDCSHNVCLASTFVSEQNIIVKARDGGGTKVKTFEDSIETSKKKDCICLVTWDQYIEYINFMDTVNYHNEIVLMRQCTYAYNKELVQCVLKGVPDAQSIKKFDWMIGIMAKWYDHERGTKDIV